MLTWKKVYSGSDGYETHYQAYLGDGLWAQIESYPNLVSGPGLSGSIWWGSTKEWSVYLKDSPEGEGELLVHADRLSDAQAWVWASMGGNALAA